MCRFASSPLLLALVLAAAGCGDSTPREASFVSQAHAAPPANAPDYGWRTEMSPTAGDAAAPEYY